jgi:hypothetical protein
MPFKEFPLIPDDLLKALNEVYPEQCPAFTENDRQIWMNVGRRDVVRFLNAKREQQMAKASKGKTTHVLS